MLDGTAAGLGAVVNPAADSFAQAQAPRSKIRWKVACKLEYPTGFVARRRR